MGWTNVRVEDSCNIGAPCRYLRLRLGGTPRCVLTSVSLTERDGYVLRCEECMADDSKLAISPNSSCVAEETIVYVEPRSIVSHSLCTPSPLLSKKVEGT